MNGFKNILSKLFGEDYSVFIFPVDLTSNPVQMDFCKVLFSMYPEFGDIYTESDRGCAYMPGDLVTYRVYGKDIALVHFEDDTSDVAVETLHVGYSRLVHAASHFFWRSVWIPRMSYTLTDKEDEYLAETLFFRPADKYVRHVTRASNTKVI